VGFTYAQALSLVGSTVPAHLAAEITVPILTGVQAQGDLLVFPHQPEPEPRWQPVPSDGVQLIRSEATGNTHWLHQDQGSRGVLWAESVPDRWVDEEDDVALRVAHLRVPEGSAALLIHTEEHGANGIGPGTYAIHRKRESDPETLSRLLAD
jgi:hypothetical protein